MPAPASRPGCGPVSKSEPVDEIRRLQRRIEAAERKVVGEIQPGGRALVVSILVSVLLVSFILPHTGAARGIDVPVGGEWR